MSELEQEVYGTLQRNYPLSESMSNLYFFQQEYEFTDKQQWRLDFAFPNLRIAIEVNGKTHQKGAHSSGTGLHRDYMKLNYAQACGWTVFQLDAELCHREGYLVDLINRTLKEKL